MCETSFTLSPKAISSTNRITWLAYRPEFRFIGYPIRKKKPVETKAAKDRQLELGLELPVAKPCKPKLTKAQAFDLLRQTLPRAYAAALAPFSALQWNPLVFLHFNGDYYDLLRSSPALAYYIANHKPLCFQIFREWRTYLPKLLAMKQRDLLDLVELPGSKQMTGIIRKIRPSSISMDNIFELQKANQYPQALKMLSHLETINAGVLHLVGSPLRILPHLTPAFLEEVSHSSRNHHIPTIYADFNACMDAHKELYPAKAFPSFFEVARFYQYQHDLALEQVKRRDLAVRVPFPPPPLPDTEAIQALATSVALYREGQKQNNCVFSYAPKVRTGKYYIYRVNKPERATLCIELYHDRWYLNEIEAAHNKPVGADTLRHVQTWLDVNQIGLGDV